MWKYFGSLLLLILFSCCGIEECGCSVAGCPNSASRCRCMIPRSPTFSKPSPKRYQYAFITRTAKRRHQRPRSIDVVAEPLKAVLDRIFAGQKVAFDFDGRLVRISKAVATPHPLSSPGRSLFRERQRRGGAIRCRASPLWSPELTKALPPDNDGHYALRVDNEHSVLQFIYLGYKKRRGSPSANARRSDVAMEEDLKMMDEVWSSSATVPSPRKTLTTSISKIDGRQALRRTGLDRRRRAEG